jgi:hypothetical protein
MYHSFLVVTESTGIAEYSYNRIHNSGVSQQHSTIQACVAARGQAGGLHLNRSIWGARVNLHENGQSLQQY